MIPKKINIRITKNNNYGLFITSLVMFTISKKKILFVIIFNEFFLKILQLNILIIINNINFGS